MACTSLGAVIGADIGYNSASKNSATGWERIGYIAASAIMGSISGLVGGGISCFGYEILDGGSLEDAFTAGGEVR